MRSTGEEKDLYSEMNTADWWMGGAGREGNTN